MAATLATAPRLLFVALMLGLAAASLLYRAEPGVNFAILSGLLTATVLYFDSKSKVRISRKAKSMLFVATGFGTLFAVRDAPGLQIANGFALVVAFGCCLCLAANPKTLKTGFFEVVFLPFQKLAKAIFKFWKLVKIGAGDQSRNSNKLQSRHFIRLGQMGLGLLLSTPLLLLFGGLFYSADAMFKYRVDRLTSTQFDFGNPAGFLSLAGVSTIIIGGVLYFLLVEPSEPTRAKSPDFIGPRVSVNAPPRAGQTLGNIEHMTVLSALVSLFAMFIGIQFESFFGGAKNISAATGLTPSEYARSGFFQLAWVAGLALLTIVFLDRVKESRTSVTTWLTRALIGLVFLVIFSAGLRMKVYMDAFGLTELRLYTSAFMVWIACSFAWMVPTVTTGNPNKFGFGAILAGFGVIAALNLVNPEALIARTNLAMEAPDYAYIGSLSKDAEAEWKSNPAVTGEQRKLLESFRAKSGHADWRGMNLSELRAH